MSRGQKVEDKVKEFEYDLAKYKAVLSKFPDAKVHYYSGFASKEVNQNYTKFYFERSYGGLYVLPYCEVEFTHNGKAEIVKVHSQPRSNRLVYITWRRGAAGKRIMKFARIAINLKNNSFKDEMLNACRAEMMGFIKDNPGYQMDDKHLEPRLKKLLVFT